MPANPNWARWIFASVADHLKSVAVTHSLPVLVDHLDDRTTAFMQASDRAEIRITGPFTQEVSMGFHRVYVDANVLLTSRYDGQKKDQMAVFKYAGFFHEAMDSPIPIWNYGNMTGDFVEGDPATQVFLGCLKPRPGKNDSVQVFHFGQTDKVDKLKQSAVNARYYMEIQE
jgi:hypothetical protein